MIRGFGEGKRLVAELGINHDGSSTVASALIHDLARGDVDSIKLQYRNFDRVYADSGDVQKELGDEMLGDELRRTSMSAEQQLELLALAHSLGLKVGISFFCVQDIEDFGNGIADFDFFKIPSAELENRELVDTLLNMDRLLLISTGGHSEEKISAALNRIDSHENWIPLHAIMNYPTQHHNAQLGYISHLAEKWRRPVGYSSHDADWEVCLFAAALGADLIERHVTHSVNASGLDHSSSSEVRDANKLARLLNAFEALQRCPDERFPNQGELINLQNLGRSYYARKDLAIGTQVDSQDFDYRVPRRGFGPEEAQQAWGLPLRRTLYAGETLSNGHFEETSGAADHLAAWADAKSLGIPIRPGDWRLLTERLPVNVREFHLSYQDVEAGLTIDSLPSDCRYSVHLPDYVNATELMNPYSQDAHVQDRSRRILRSCLNFARELQELSGLRVPVVGSFSAGRGDSIESFFEGQRELVDEWERSSVSLVHQWLPPYAWYFGGSVPVHRFNAREDLELCSTYKIPLCLDTAHAALCVNAGRVSVEDFLQLAQPLVVHSHIAGARGVDAEGIAISESDDTCKTLIGWAMKLPTLKILERWQGHFFGGKGFLEDLMTLRELD